MREKLKKLFYRWGYLDITGECKKDGTYFYRFSREIGQNNFRMMRSMSVFILVISILVFASTFSYFVEHSLRKVYIPIIVLEIIILVLLQWISKKECSSRACNFITPVHLFHMLAISGYIGVFYCQDETALPFVVFLTISSMVFTIPTMLSMSISTFCTLAMAIASYYVKERFWFESDVFNGISVLIFSFLFGLKVNRIRAEGAFSRADALRLNEELKRASITDQLTGLYNHRSFQDSYYEMFHRSSTKGLPLGVIMMDLDNFKAFNDTYGHVAGDDCLRRVASAIAVSVPEGTIVCRYGGEEFIALLNEELCYDVEIVGEKVRKAVEALGIHSACATSVTGAVTMSLGAYVGVPGDGEKPMSFVERADKAMYQSKSGGRNRLTATFE